MAKKKYQEALAGAFNQFITATQPDTPPLMPPETVNTSPEPPQNNWITAEEAEARQERARNNAQYISTPPATYRTTADMFNPRGRRVQLLFRHDMHSQLRAIAHSKGQSFNNLVEEILTDYLNQRGNQ